MNSVSKSLFLPLLALSLSLFTPDHASANMLWGYKSIMAYDKTGLRDEVRSRTLKEKAPQGFNASVKWHYDKVSLNWLQVKEAIRYHIYRSYSENGTFQKIGSTKELYYEDRTVLPFTDAYYKVTAEFEGIGEGAPSVVKTGSRNLMIEAEDGILSGSAVKASSQFNASQNQYVTGFLGIGDKAQFDITIPNEANYAFRLRYANATGNNMTISISVNGVKARKLVLPPLSTWNTWSIKEEILSLHAGNNTLSISFLSNDTGHVNIDYFQMACSGPYSVISNSLPESIFGPNVVIFSSNTPLATIQAKIDEIYAEQRNSQFGTGRYAIFFSPGSYPLSVPLGFYTSIYGLGDTPDKVNITGTSFYSEAYLGGNNSTCNFWRSVENVSATPSDGYLQWAVSQACPFRRVHVKGNLVLHQNGGWASGGFIADSWVDGNVNSGSQQQWYSRNTEWGSWSGSVWNMFFQGIINPPTGNWPTPPYTRIATTPQVREKPYLYMDGSGTFQVRIPSLRTNQVGTTWKSGMTPGISLPISDFHITQPGLDTAATINTALESGKNILFTPGNYSLNETINVTRPNTIILGLGYPTLIPVNGNKAMTIADVDGVIVAGILFEAGAVNSPVLLEVGPPGSSVDHSSNPISLHDLFFRIGGYQAGKASVSIQINSDNVLGDHFWVWRADHGDNGSVGWDINTAANGLVVNGDNVTIYGLFVEHFQEYQTLWNGENGRVFFYQNELPYDPPNQNVWMAGTTKGWAAYKVNDSVNTHEAWGLGIYSVFSYPGIQLQSAIEVPNKPGVRFHHMRTCDLNQGVDNIIHIINDKGASVGDGGNFTSVWDEYP
jgi:hypothetical protein